MEEEVDLVLEELKALKSTLQTCSVDIGNEYAKLRESGKKITAVKRKLMTIKKLPEEMEQTLDNNVFSPLIQEYTSKTGIMNEYRNSLDIESLKHHIEIINELVQKYGKDEMTEELEKENTALTELETHISNLEKNIENASLHFQAKETKENSMGEHFGNSSLGGVSNKFNPNNSLFMEDLSQIGYNTEFIHKTPIDTINPPTEVNSFFGAINSYITIGMDTDALLYMLRNGVKDMKQNDMDTLIKICRIAGSSQEGKVKLINEIADILSKLSYDDFCCLRDSGALRHLYNYMFEIV